MTWTVLLHEEFSDEIDYLSTEVKEKLFMYAGQLEEFGWSLERIIKKAEKRYSQHLLTLTKK